MLDLYNYPLFVIFVAGVVLILAASEIGRRIGMHASAVGGGNISTLESAVLGLMALMIGFTFAILHHRAFVQDSTAYLLGVEGTGRSQLNWADFIYFSFVSLTTVGFGDIVPKSAWARNLSVMEAFVGMLYPAILLARLVNRAQGERDQQPAKPA